MFFVAGVLFLQLKCLRRCRPPRDASCWSQGGLQTVLNGYGSSRLLLPWSRSGCVEANHSPDLSLSFWRQCVAFEMLCAKTWGFLLSMRNSARIPAVLYQAIWQPYYGWKTAEVVYPLVLVVGGLLVLSKWARFAFRSPSFLDPSFPLLVTIMMNHARHLARVSGLTLTGVPHDQNTR